MIADQDGVLGVTMINCLFLVNIHISILKHNIFTLQNMNREDPDGKRMIQIKKQDYQLRKYRITREVITKYLDSQNII